MTDNELIKRLCLYNWGCMTYCKHAYLCDNECGYNKSCDFDDICNKKNNYAYFELNRELIEKELEDY